MKSQVIVYKSKAEWDRLAKELDRRGIKWVMGERATAWSPAYIKYPHGVSIHSDKHITHCDPSYYASRAEEYEPAIGVNQFIKGESMELKIYDNVYLKKDYNGHKEGEKFQYNGGQNFSSCKDGRRLLVAKYERGNFFTKGSDSELKVGDLVRIVRSESSPGHSHLPTQEYVGREAVVKRISSFGGHPISLEGIPDQWADYELEKVEDKPEEIKKPAVIEKGSLVKIAKNSQYFSSQSYHGVGTVDRNLHAGSSYGFVNFHDGYTNTYHYKDLDVVDCVLPKHRRTFRLLKETPVLKAGAVVQEACDAGDQEYVLLDGQEDFVKVDDLEVYDLEEVEFSRKTVETQPDWFEEVYKLEKEVTKTVTEWATKSEYINAKA